MDTSFLDGQCMVVFCHAVYEALHVRRSFESGTRMSASCWSVRYCSRDEV